MAKVIKYKGRIYKAADGISPEEISVRYKDEYEEAVRETAKAKQQADKILRLAKKNKAEVEKYLKEYNKPGFQPAALQKVQEAFDRLYYNARAAVDMMKEGEGAAHGGTTR